MEEKQQNNSGSSDQQHQQQPQGKAPKGQDLENPPPAPIKTASPIRQLDWKELLCTPEIYLLLVILAFFSFCGVGSK